MKITKIHNGVWQGSWYKINKHKSVALLEAWWGDTVVWLTLPHSYPPRPLHLPCHLEVVVRHSSVQGEVSQVSWGAFCTPGPGIATFSFSSPSCRNADMELELHWVAFKDKATRSKRDTFPAIIKLLNQHW